MMFYENSGNSWKFLWYIIQTNYTARINCCTPRGSFSSAGYSVDMSATKFIEVDFVPWDKLPRAYQTRPLYQAVDIKNDEPSTSKSSSNTENSNTEKPKSQGFSFGKALSGIKAEEGCAYNSRGDGRFDDGSQIKAQCVIISLLFLCFTPAFMFLTALLMTGVMWCTCHLKPWPQKMLTKLWQSLMQLHRVQEEIKTAPCKQAKTPA